MPTTIEISDELTEGLKGLTSETDIVVIAANALAAYSFLAEHSTDDIATIVKQGGEHLRFGITPEAHSVVDSLTVHQAESDEWQWPKWLTAPWIARDSNDSWWGYDLEPVLRSTSFAPRPISHKWKLEMLKGFDESDLPVDDDWAESKRKNPHLVESKD